MPPKRGLARLIQQLKTDDWVSRVVDMEQEKGAPERWVAPDLTIHPSWGGGECPREIQLTMLGHRDKIEPKSRRRMDNGTDAHTRWQRYFKEVGLLVDCEIRLNLTDPLWSGSADVILQNPVTGRKYVGELKTMHSRRWAKVPAQVYDRYEMMRQLALVERKYVNQLTQYIVKLRQEGYGVEEEGFFLFENTDTQEYKVRYCAPDRDMQESAFANAVLAQEASLEGRLIDPPFKRKSLTCRACYRERLCYDIQDGEAPLDIVRARLREVSNGE